MRDAALAPYFMYYDSGGFLKSWLLDTSLADHVSNLGRNCAGGVSGWAMSDTSRAPNPNFSGHWVFSREASTLSPNGADRIRSGHMHIEHREPNFRCQFRYDFDDGNHFEGSFQLATDGHESEVLEKGRPSLTSLRWDGDVLVFAGREQGTIVLRHELLDAGKRLRISEQNRGMGHDQDNTFVFDREASSP